MTKDFLPIYCPNCGDAVDVALDELEYLHSGMTVVCPACDGAITFQMFGEEESWNAILAAERERACHIVRENCPACDNGMAGERPYGPSLDMVEAIECQYCGEMIAAIRSAEEAQE